MSNIFSFFRRTRPTQVKLTESVKGESAINSTNEIGAPVLYEFRVRNQFTQCFIMFLLQ